MVRTLLFLNVILLPLFNFAALVLTCPGDSNVSYQSECQFVLGDYTSTVGVVSSDGPTFFSQLPAPGTVISATTMIEITVTDTGGNIKTCRFNIVLPPPPQITLTTTPPHCYGEADGSISSVVSGGLPPYTYQWTNGQTSANANGLAAGNYGLVVHDANGCQTLEEVNLTQPSKVDLTGYATTFTGGSNISVNGATDGSIITTTTGGLPPYYWEWSNEDTGETIDSLGIGEYKVVVTDMNGCVDTMAFTLTGPFNVVIPEGISPNGDGINDVLIIKNMNDYPDNELTIFNRWGDIVYHAKPYANDWDGKNHGSLQFINNDLPDGIYYYHFKVDDGKNPTLKGYIILKRK